MGWLRISINVCVRILLCSGGNCSSKWTLATYDISTSALLRLDRAKVIIWSVMTVISAGERRLLLLELALTSFRRAEAIS